MAQMNPGEKAWDNNNNNNVVYLTEEYQNNQQKVTAAASAAKRPPSPKQLICHHVFLIPRDGPTPTPGSWDWPEYPADRVVMADVDKPHQTLEVAASDEINRSVASTPFSSPLPSTPSRRKRAAGGDLRGGGRGRGRGRKRLHTSSSSDGIIIASGNSSNKDVDVKEAIAEEEEPPTSETPEDKSGEEEEEYGAAEIIPMPPAIKSPSSSPLVASSSSSTASSMTSSSKKPRTCFSDSQCSAMRAVFNRTPYLNSRSRAELARALNISEETIAVRGKTRSTFPVRLATSARD